MKRYLIYFSFTNGSETGESNVVYACESFDLDAALNSIKSRLPASDGNYLPKRYSVLIKFMIEL